MISLGQVDNHLPGVQPCALGTFAQDHVHLLKRHLNPFGLGAAAPTTPGISCKVLLGLGWLHSRGRFLAPSGVLLSPSLPATGEGAALAGPRGPKERQDTWRRRDRQDSGACKTLEGSAQLSWAHHVLPLLPAGVLIIWWAQDPEWPEPRGAVIGRLVPPQVTCGDQKHTVQVYPSSSSVRGFLWWGFDLQQQIFCRKSRNCLCAESVSGSNQSTGHFVTPWTIAPGSSVGEILQARILERIAIPFSRGPSGPRDWAHVFYCLLHCMQILYHLSHQERPKEKDTFYATLIVVSRQSAGNTETKEVEWNQHQFSSDS